tara:strand:- start:344 stop:1324 length:981 start_codon:yes stop_codon:yes gene_type:complete
MKTRLPREDETLRIENFEIGYSYSRHEIAKIGKVSPLINNKEWTGIVEFSNIFILFVTLVKADDKPKSQHYLDYFDNSKFYWESQDRQDQKNEQILRIIDNSKEIVLFCRHHEKTKSTTQPFFYFGELAPESYQDNKPVKFRFHSLDYSPNISQDLQQIYNWKPPSSATSITIQNYDPLESLKKRLANMEFTDTEATVKRRREQQILADILFLDKTEESCSICHKVMPTELLHAAHIKQRSECTKKEKTDPNIVMPLCKLGCDDLFEQGFILINSKGRIKKNSNTLISKDLDLHLESLVELECTSFNKNTAPYFKHRYASNSKNNT